MRASIYECAGEQLVCECKRVITAAVLLCSTTTTSPTLQMARCSRSSTHRRQWTTARALSTPIQTVLCSSARPGCCSRQPAQPQACTTTACTTTQRQERASLQHTNGLVYAISALLCMQDSARFAVQRRHSPGTLQAVAPARICSSLSCLPSALATNISACVRAPLRFRAPLLQGWRALPTIKMRRALRTQCLCPHLLQAFRRSIALHSRSTTAYMLLVGTREARSSQAGHSQHVQAHPP